jgi:hypothetical protein
VRGEYGGEKEGLFLCGSRGFTVPIYFNFNLNGFTAALNRALSLTNNDDASYFETPKEPSKSKSDASYFEI